MTRFGIALCSRCHVVVPSMFLKQMDYSTNVCKLKSKYFSLEPALSGASHAFGWRECLHSNAGWAELSSDEYICHIRREF